MRPAPLSLGLLLVAAGASAQEEQRWEPGNRTTSRVEGEVEAPEAGGVSDGVYGRFEGDLEISVGAGAELDEHGQRGALRLALHYFSMIGVAATYAERLGGEGALRSFAAGVDLRPAFIPRWSENLEQGPGFVDLMIDSISLGLGGFWAEPPGGDFGEVRGFELSGGLGIPLFGRAPGLWLEARAVGRWAEVTSSASGRGEGVALITLSWHAFASTPWAPEPGS
jgi:hypothetical protein